MTKDSKPVPSRPCADKDRQETAKEAEWRAGFEAMANDPEAMDVEYAFPAQAEVVLGSEAT